MDDDTFETEDIEEAVSDEAKKAYETAKTAVKERCAKTGIETQEIETPFDDDKGLEILFPCGRNKRSLIVWDSETAADLLSIHFEDFVYLGNYDAICSYKYGTIEASIRPVGIVTMVSSMRSKLFPGCGEDREKDEDLRREIEPSPEYPNIKLSIQTTSKELNTLSERRRTGGTRFSLMISGLNVSRHDQALSLLEIISHSLFFQIDLSIGLPLNLLRQRNIVRRIRRREPSEKTNKLTFPCYHYDSEPISLYWYGRSAFGMPLLQYLAYYQSIEFYFPVYSQMEAKQKVRNVIKNPTFNVHSDSDIGRILALFKRSGSRGFGDEKSNLRATIHECTTAEDLRSFITADKTVTEFFQDKNNPISAARLNIANPDHDLRADVAERIYDIRCKIVHTKVNDNDGSQEFILPFSKESEQMHYDIDLIQFIAQKIIISSSNPLRI